ncbi:ABC transporter permease [Galbibacter sp. BG1]|uniref:ABC transporter permease n=1 Tax=Galbibacter sp. BG1 TaxID=1170699 RepID=UPI0015BD6050|nr:ABC transporter permease [Galbibacter sp. BG1]QLE00037.1 ABC transporter permease [Galbibacter sp. BG1]
MRVLWFLIQKEFIQIFRNKALLPMMTILPVIQLLLLSNAASNEVKNVNIAVVDNDQSEFSKELTDKIMANKRFSLIATPFGNKEAMKYMQGNEVDIILQIPANFEKKFLRKEQPSMQVLVNAVNGQQATVGSGYLINIISTFNKSLIENVASFTMSKTNTATIVNRNWYNPELKYTHFMAPGILAELTALLTIVLSAMNVVREREIGTIEQINVTPIKKWQFILGKLIPFLCIGIFLLIIGLTVSKIIFNIPMRGSLITLFLYAIVNLVAVLGFGLLISNFANTQQQAIFVAFFFILIFILMCGLFTPIESMPKWAQYATIPNPLAHFISVARKVLMKGSGWAAIKMEFIYTLVLAIIFNTLAIISYRKQES